MLGMPRRFPLVIFLLFLLLVLVIPLPSAHAIPSIVSTSRISGGAGLCGGALPACTFTPPDPSISDQPPVAFSLSILGQDGSSAEADDPWHSDNAPSSGLNFGNSRYQFVIQEDSGRQPYIVVGGGDSITWSWDSSTSRITLTATTIRAHFTTPPNEYSGLGFAVLDQRYSSDINGTNVDDFRGITIETNAETFTFGIVSPTNWTLTATGRTGTTGFWRACIPRETLDAVGAVAGDINLQQNNVDKPVTPTLTTGKVTIDGVDKPCYLIDLSSISFSTQTFETSFAASGTSGTKQVDSVSLGDGMAASSFIVSVAGAWGASSGDIQKRIDEGITAANKGYPATVGQPYTILASGGNIMPGKGGYLQVVFGGNANMVMLLSYGVDGSVSALSQANYRVKGTGNSPASSSPPSVAPPADGDSPPPKKPAIFMFTYKLQHGVRYIEVEHDRGTDYPPSVPVVPQPAAERLGDEAFSEKRGSLEVILATMLTVVLTPFMLYLGRRFGPNENR